MGSEYDEHYLVCPCLAVQGVDCLLCLSVIGGIFLQISGVELPQDILNSRPICHRCSLPTRLFSNVSDGLLILMIAFDVICRYFMENLS